MAVILDPENKKRAATRRTRIAAHQHGSRLPSVHSWGCVGGLGDLATLLAVAPPKGPSMPSAVRNYADPQHFCRYRGYDSAWVPGTMLGARVGRPNLLFGIEPGLTGLPWFLCTTRPLTQQGPILRKLRSGFGLRGLDVCCPPARARSGGLLRGPVPPRATVWPASSLGLKREAA